MESVVLLSATVANIMRTTTFLSEQHVSLCSQMCNVVLDAPVPPPAKLLTALLHLVKNSAPLAVALKIMLARNAAEAKAVTEASLDQFIFVGCRAIARIAAVLAPDEKTMCCLALHTLLILCSSPIIADNKVFQDPNFYLSMRAIMESIYPTREENLPHATVHSNNVDSELDCDSQLATCSALLLRILTALLSRPLAVAHLCWEPLAILRVPQWLVSLSIRAPRTLSWFPSLLDAAKLLQIISLDPSTAEIIHTHIVNPTGTDREGRRTRTMWIRTSTHDM